MFEKHVNIWNELWKNYRRKTKCRHRIFIKYIIFGLEGKGDVVHISNLHWDIWRKIFFETLYFQKIEILNEVIWEYFRYIHVITAWGLKRVTFNFWNWTDFEMNIIKFVCMKLRLAIAFYLGSVTGLKFYALCAGYYALLS